jgi:AcrR family transcriptional regulator
VDQIAAAAGVSRPTVFTSVGGKPALLEAAWNVALVGDDEPVALPDRVRSREIMAESDPSVFLSAYVALVVEVHTRVAGIFDAVRAAATADPAIGELYDKIQAERYVGATHVVELLLSKGQLRPGLTRAVAVDVLWALIEPTMYRLFVHERGWPVEQYRRWLDQTLQGQLLPVRADR